MAHIDVFSSIDIGQNTEVNYLMEQILDAIADVDQTEFRRLTGRWVDKVIEFMDDEAVKQEEAEGEDLHDEYVDAHLLGGSNADRNG